MQVWFKIDLWKRVIAFLFLGLAVGLGLRYAMGPEAGGAWVTAYIYPIGQAFVALIRMLIVPLIFTTLTAGVIAMGDPKRLGSLGGRALALYFGTTAVAVSLGLVIGSLLRPGAQLSEDTFAAAGAASISGVTDRLERADSVSLADRFIGFDPVGDVGSFLSAPLLNFGLLAFLVALSFLALPRNRNMAVLVAGLFVAAPAFAGMNILAIIALSLALGLALLIFGASESGLARTVERAANGVMKVTEFVMETAPFGVFALMAWVMATQGLGVLSALGLLAAALYLTCILHILITYGGIVGGLLGLDVRAFYRGVVDAQAVAYSTASSSATLPVTIACAEDNLGINKSVAGSVLPLGATINMDGTAIYLGLVALFAAQALGLPLTPGMYLAVALTATLSSIGAAGIPSAGLLLATVVLEQVGVSAEQAVLVIAFIFPFDRLLDMMRTLTNVTGDAAVATAVAKWEGELDTEVFIAKDAAAAARA
ncbi:MAG: dicarboxylate/amino acid:cation symporter [Pseudomonadota bacterium]